MRQASIRRLAILALTALVLATAGAGVTPAAELLPGGSFADDNANTHEGMIEAIAGAGVTQGCSTTGLLYCPGDDVTRGQMASFLARAFDLATTSEDFFDDDAGSTHEDNINRIAAAGITLGFGDGTYRPEGLVSRDQMGSFIARAMGLDPVPGDRFEDVSGTHEGNINAIAAAGVTQGCNAEGTRYCPVDNVRRDQMASFLGRALELAPIIPPPDLEVSYGPGEPVTIGLLVALTGVGDLGVEQQRGVEIALTQMGSVNGHPLQYVAHDSQCNREEVPAAAAAVVADPTVAAIVGTTCSGAATIAAPIISDAGFSMISPSNTSAVLTDPATHAAGYLRVAWNDAEQGAVLAAHAAGTLGATTAAAVFDDPGEFLTGSFTEAFTALGGTSLAMERLDDIDTALDAVIAAGPPDVLLVASSDAAPVVIAARAKPALDGTTLLGHEPTFNDEFLAAAGMASEGMVVVAPDRAPTGPAYDAFESAYQVAFGSPPLIPIWSALAADAAGVIVDAIELIGIDNNGTLTFGRQGLRNALFATSGYSGITGPITCNELGDCSGVTMNLWKVENGSFVAP